MDVSGIRKSKGRGSEAEAVGLLSGATKMIAWLVGNEKEKSSASRGQGDHARLQETEQSSDLISLLL